MVKIKPLRVTLYNQRLIGNLSKVICPPYDVITSKQIEEYYKLHPFNMIKLILSRPRIEMLGDKKVEINRYTNARNIFFDWLKKDILIRDKFKCFYLYEQSFLFKKQERRRIGFFGLLRLSDEKIFSHEHTKEKPKEDRLLLLKSTEANLCPIFVIFRDEEKILNYIYKLSSKRTPFIEIKDRDRIHHRLWRITKSSLIDKLKRVLEKKEVYIADGHHRYETACTYRDLRKEGIENFTGREDFNYILTYFTDSESEGLVILAVHRAIKRRAEISKILKIYFEIEEKKDKLELFRSMERLSKRSCVFGMYKDKRFFSLHLKKSVLSDRITDVELLNFIFKESNLETKDIIYSEDANRIIEAIDKNEAKLGFFLNPLRVSCILEIASEKKRLPSKSSYFYPKVPSGLLINKFK